MCIKIHTSELRQSAKVLSAGTELLLSGTVYTARDAAHSRIIQLLDKNCSPPFQIKDSTIYYCGPTPFPKSSPSKFGSCGPTTSGRMDKFSPRLLDLGLSAMIGKGARSPDVIKSIVKNGALYLCAVGGAGALYSKCIELSTEVAFPELGCESVKRLDINNFPVFVGIDCNGVSFVR